MATQPAEGADATAAQPKCYFMTIPGEIRNRIYDYVFTNNGGEGPVEVFKFSPPSNNIIMSCRQVYQEARELYKAAYRLYWSENDFNFIWRPHSDEEEAGAKLRNFSDADVAAISCMKFSDRVEGDFSLRLASGVWTKKSSGDVSSFLVVPESRLHSLPLGLGAYSSWICHLQIVKTTSMSAAKVETVKNELGVPGLTRRKLLVLISWWYDTRPRTGCSGWAF